MSAKAYCDLSVEKHCESVCEYIADVPYRRISYALLLCGGVFVILTIILRAVFVIRNTVKASKVVVWGSREIVCIYHLLIIYHKFSDGY